MIFQDLEIYDLMLANEQGDDDSDSDSAEDFSTSSNNMTNSVIEMASAFEGKIRDNSEILSKIPSILASPGLKARNLEVLDPDTEAGSDSSFGRREKVSQTFT